MGLGSLTDLALIGFGPVEAIVVVVVVLVVFGAGRLAGVGKALGTGLREFREEAKKPGDEDDDAAASTTQPSASSDSADKKS